MKPNIDFLKTSGLVLDKRIIVDKFMMINISNIFVAGDSSIEDQLYRAPILHNMRIC